ncbi:hypothetical protein AURDEDRAFT_113761 [Auricularia subglabra TFB-10046 SS5]|nr:hypothetical protein AURDEDRAFT_113761 [Auricularia subglabra TFB-10046 SS5]
MSKPSDAQRALLAAALVEPKPFYAEGIWSLPHEQLNLFLRTEPWCIDLGKDAASVAELDKLAAACQPATFGVNQEDVLDESYRKAGKLDNKDFAINIDLVRSGLLQAVHDGLFSWEASPRNIQAELYKLNVYGPGSFFKAHKDTPRGEEMFGSLVLNFPVKHEGGALVLRHDGNEVKHDASSAPYSSQDQVSWVAFYSDVEHEVLPVTSGHRVTITYNLYFASDAATPPVKSEPLLQALKGLLADETFMPNGGRLGFGLKHQYPVPAEASRRAAHILQDVAKCLKAGDRALFESLASVGLDPKLWMIYDTDGYGVYLLDHVYEGGEHYEASWDEVLVEWNKGEKIENGTDDEVYNEKTRGWMPAPALKTDLTWIVPRNQNSRVESHYIAYGNEASLESIYGDLALIVKVPAKEERAA